jgi:hypothetical protein
MRPTTLVGVILVPTVLVPPASCTPRDEPSPETSRQEPAESSLLARLQAAQEEPGEEDLNTLSDEEVAAGFYLLFDGETLDEWRGYQMDRVPEGWRVEEGTIHFSPDLEGGDIITRRQYDSFELRFEWKISEGGNSGVMFRVSEDTRNTYRSGPEMQVLDDARHPDGRDPKTSAGANYGLHAPSIAAARTPGEWNDVRIVVQDSHVEYWLNGTKVVEYELGSEAWKALVAETKFADWPTYGSNPAGHIALQDHGDEVWYRNLRVRSLSQ